MSKLIFRFNISRSIAYSSIFCYATTKLRHYCRLMTFAKLTSFLTKNTKSNLLFVYETLACFWNIWAFQR